MAANTALPASSSSSYTMSTQQGPMMNAAGPSADVDNGYVTNRSRLEYQLIVRQEPKQARMCGVGGKADRRPIDPPPIVQLRVVDPLAPPRQPAPRRSPSPSTRKGKRKARRDGDEEGDDRDRHRAGSSTPPPQNPPSNPAYYRERASAPEPERDDEDYRDARDNEYPHDAAGYAQSYLQNPYYFMFASLAKPHEDQELHWLKDGRTRCTTGSVVSSLYHLKDPQNNNEDAGFFVFPDLSVRTEGSYRLKLSLYEVVGNNVRHCKSIYSAPFYVYTAKKFPGMEESTPLSCALADQGIKIRIRKDIRVRKRPNQGTPTTTLAAPGESSGQGNDTMDVDEARGREKRRKSNERADETSGGDKRRQRSSSKARERSLDRRNDSPTPTAGGSETPKRATKRSRTDDGPIHIPSPMQSSIPPPPSAIPPPSEASGTGVPIGSAQPIPVPQQHPWPPIAPLDPTLGPAIPPPPGVSGGSQTQTPQPDPAATQASGGQMVIPPPPGAAGIQATPQQVQSPASQSQMQPQQAQPAAYGTTMDSSASGGYGMYAPQAQTHTPSGYDSHGQPQYQQPQQYGAPAPAPYATAHGHGHIPPPPAHGPPPPMTHQHSGYAPAPPPQSHYAGQPQPQPAQAWGPPPPVSHQPPRYDYGPAPGTHTQAAPPPPGPSGGYGAPPPPPQVPVQGYPHQQQVYTQPQHQPQPYYDAYGQPQYMPPQPQPQYQQPPYGYQHHQPPPPPTHTGYQQGVQTPAQGTYPPAGPPPGPPGPAPGHYGHPQPQSYQSAPPATHYQYYDTNGYTTNGGNPPAPAPTSGATNADTPSRTGAAGNGARTTTPPPNGSTAPVANGMQSPSTGYAPQASSQGPTAVPPTLNDNGTANGGGYNGSGYYAPPAPQHQHQQYQHQQYPPQHQQQYPYPPQHQQPYHPPPPQGYPQQRQQYAHAPPAANTYPTGYGGYPAQPQQQPPPHPHTPLTTSGQYPQHHQQQLPPPHQQVASDTSWGTPPVGSGYGSPAVASTTTGGWDGYHQGQPSGGGAPNGSPATGNGADRIQLAPLRTGVATDGSPSPVVGSAGAPSAGGQTGGYAHGVVPISRSSRDGSVSAGGGAAYGYSSQGPHSGVAMSNLRDERWGGPGVERSDADGYGGRDPHGQRDSRGSIGSIRGGRDEERITGVSERARERERSGSGVGRGKRNPLSIGNIISGRDE